MLLEFFTKKYRKESLEKSQEILRLKDENEKLKEENKRLDELIRDLKQLNENYNIFNSEIINEKIEIINKYSKLKSNILKLFQCLGFKKDSYLISVQQMNNKDLINDIFQNLKEENEE